MMNSQYLDELAALNALGALDGEDLVEFKRLVPNVTPEAQKDIASYEQVASLVAYVNAPPKTPRRAVKDKLMKRIHESFVAERSKEGPGFLGNARQEFSFLYSNQGEWMKHPVEGVFVKQLSIDEKNRYATILMKVAPGTIYPEHNHTGPEECYVLQGSIRVAGHTLRVGDFHHANPDTHHGEIVSDEGALLLLVVAAEDYLT